MTLTFELRPSFGHDRFYAVNNAAKALVALTGRKCLVLADLEALELAGFVVEFTGIQPLKRSV